ncbi:MAG: elongation factor P [Phycisphaerae bacterium]|nr:elongation factor P [Phycisphaerae bacterium]
MARASEIRRGHAVIYKGNLNVIVSIQHVAKGNWRSYYQMKLRNLKSGQLVEDRFRVDEELETAFIEKKPMEYLYSDGTGHVLMDLQTYDQITMGDEIMGDGTMYLKPNTEVQVTIYEGKIIGIELPNTVDLQVTDTPPAIKGATATNQSKDATLETGVRVKVPPFVEAGEMIRVDTRTGEYIERVK